MRGRLTRDRINAALDELAGHAEGNAALVLAARRNRPLGADKRHAIWMLYNIEVGRWWGGAGRHPGRSLGLAGCFGGGAPLTCLSSAFWVRRSADVRLLSLLLLLPLPQCAEPLRGRPWVLEADLKAGAHLRLDKSGKAMLTLLRHLGRLAEVRAAALGAGARGSGRVLLRGRRQRCRCGKSPGRGPYKLLVEFLERARLAPLFVLQPTR